MSVNNVTVYRIICENKSYIGATTQKLSRRVSQHKYSAKNNKIKNSNLYENIKKGVLFKVEELEKCSKEDMYEREIYWIKKFNSHKDGYNLSAGGKGANNRIVPHEECIKKSEISKKRWEDEDIRKRLTESRKHIFNNKEEQSRKGKLGAQARINKFPTKLCFCKNTNKLIGEFKTSIDLSLLLNITKYQAHHYLHGKTKAGRELYKFVEKRRV